MTRADAIALILSIVDAAQSPAAPAIADGPAQSDPKKSAARQRGTARRPSPFDHAGAAPAKPSRENAAPPKPSSSLKKLPHAPAPPAGDEDKLIETLTACALLDTSDTDNGQRLIAHFGDDIVVRAESEVPAGTFLHWTGTHWDLDSGAAEVAKIAQKVGDLIKREADYIPATKPEAEAIDAGKKAKAELDALKAATPERDWNEDQQQQGLLLTVVIKAGEAAYSRWSKRKADRRTKGVTAKNAGKIAAMLDTAGPHLRRSPDLFNVDPYRLATKAHTLVFHRTVSPETTETVRWDASLKVIKGHERQDYITACIPVVYDPKATIIKFREFIERFLPDPEVRRTVQQFCALALLNIPTQRYMIHYGEKGANGKSTFLEVLFRLFGPSFAVGLGQESIAGGGQRAAGGPQADIARLHGKRLVRITELKEGVPLQEDVIKRLTGGEALPTRTLFKGYFEFIPLAKPHFSCNGYPKIDGNSDAMWRRALIVEWPVHLQPHEQRDFNEVVGEMLAEAPGILNWLIDGALDYLAGGLYVAPGVQAATQTYRDTMDTVGVFHRACVREKAGGRVQSRAMYQAYLHWCQANAKVPVKETRFGLQMKKLCRKDDTGAVHAYVEIELHDVPEPPPEHGGHAPPARNGPSSSHDHDEIAF